MIECVFAVLKQSGKLPGRRRYRERSRIIIGMGGNHQARIPAHRRTGYQLTGQDELGRRDVRSRASSYLPSFFAIIPRYACKYRSTIRVEENRRRAASRQSSVLSFPTSFI